MYIEINKNKEPYIKELSNDKIINLTALFLLLYLFYFYAMI